MKISSVGIIYNPISGGGRGKRLAEETLAHLKAKDLQVSLFETSSVEESSSFESFIKANQAIVVVGGDGTMMRVLPHVKGSMVPIYMVPAGNESLFAREFGMSRDPSALLAAIYALNIVERFVGVANGKPFFSMASVGFDAEVIRILHSKRSGPVGHIGYLIPILKSFFGYRPPNILLKVDDVSKIQGRRGLLVVSNSSQYALRATIVPEASPKDASLHARFFPYRHRSELIFIVARSLFSKRTSEKYPLFVGKRFEVEVLDSARAPIQCDGEAIGRTPLVVERDLETIRVLLPRPCA